MKDTTNIFQELIRIQESGEEAALCVLTKVNGSSPQITGAKMIVTKSGRLIGTVGGGAIEKKLMEHSLEVINSQTPKTIQYHLVKDLNMACGGQVEAYIEPIETQGRLVLFGAGHVAKATAQVAKLLGFKVTVVDDRQEWANRELYPTADEIIVSEFSDYVKTQTFGAKDHLLIVTRGHSHDQLILESVIRGEFGWLGMIGSKSKVSAAFKRLREIGLSEDKIKRIESPVGLDIGAVSPEEIAISVTARLVQFKRKGIPAQTDCMPTCL